MAFQLNKVITNDQINAWREQIFLSPIALGFDAHVVESIEVTHTKLGGTFEITLEAQQNNPGLVLDPTGETPVTALVLGNNIYNGTVTSVVPSASRSGVVLKVGGVLEPFGLRSTPGISFSSADPFISGAGTILPSPNLVGMSNFYRELGMSAFRAIEWLILRSGAQTVSGISLAHNYPIWQFETSTGGALEAIETLANYACTHALLDRTGALRFIPWGSNLNVHTFDASEIIDVLEPRFEVTDFTDVVVQPDSTITPWNSTYAGTPEKITDISFKAGPSNSTDSAAGQGGVEVSDEWSFPPSLDNRWFTLSTTESSFNTDIFNALGVKSVWKAVSTSASNLSFQSLPTKMTATTIDASELALAGKSEIKSYNILYSWGRAVTKIEPAGDIYHYVYVLPGNGSSDFVANFNVDSSDIFNVKLEGYQRAQGDILDLGKPPGIERLTPRGYWAPIYSDSDLTQAGTAVDGSFYLGLKPHNWKIRTELGQQPRLSTSEVVVEGQDIISKTPLGANFEAKFVAKTGNSIETYVNAISQTEEETVLGEFTVTFSCPGVSEFSESIAKINSGIAPEVVYGGTVISPELNDYDVRRKEAFLKVSGFNWGQTAFEEYPPGRFTSVREGIIRAYLQNIGNWISSGSDLLVLPATYKDRKIRVVGNFIKEIVITPEESYGILALNLDSLPKDKKENLSTFKLGRVVYQGGVLVSTEPISSTVQASSVSGPVDAAPEMLEGSWSIYGLKRKTYPPTVMCPVGGLPSFGFNGQQPYLPDNAKVISGGLITDYWGPLYEQTHAGVLATSMASFLSRVFCSVTIKVPLKNGMNIPQPGDWVSVSNADSLGINTPYEVAGTVVQVRISITRSGGILEIQTGILETL